MRDNASVVAGCGYVLTLAGLRALDFGEPCDCRPQRIGREVVCPECGTSYGTISMASRATPQWERKRD